MQFIVFKLNNKRGFFVTFFPLRLMKESNGRTFASLPVFVTTISSQATHLAWLGTAPKSVRRLRIALRPCGGNRINITAFVFLLVARQFK